ncbi:hypothetical protein PLESTM_000167400 [Pleodorina starrii]|nr:hypothetical protein PLESTM_000167400 [Pleodorina starrii]
MEAATEQDPQRLLADLAAEYERSRRFLEQLESNFVREPPPAPPTGLLYSPAGNGDHHDEPSAALDHPAEAPPHAAAETVPQRESVPSKLRAKLRSLFTRSVSVAARSKVSESGSTAAAVGRTASESQSSVSARTVQRTTTFAERPATSVSASPPPRRTSQVYYATNPAEVPRVPRAARGDADSGRPATGRRTSVLYFGGDAMDSSAQGWLARVGGAEPPAERPGTGRRASIDVPLAMDAAGGAAAAAGRGVRTSIDFTVTGGGGGGGGGVAERPATARRASIVQFGDTVAVPGGGGGNSGGGSGGHGLVGVGADADSGTSPRAGDGGPPSATARRGPSVHFAGGGAGVALQDTANPHEFMSAMAGPRRATSFQQRSGTALLPTSAQRLRSATTTVRRTSIEAFGSRDPPPQQPQQPLTQQLQQPQQQPGPSRVSIEGRHTLMGPSAPDQLSATGRRAGSLEIPRPFSASRQHPGGSTAAAAPAVNINASALFSPASTSVSLAGSAAPVAALAAAATAAVAAGPGRPERPPSPQGAMGWGIGGQHHLRLQQPHGGIAWAPPAAAAAAVPTAMGAISPTGNPVSVGPTSPGDAAAAAALLAGRGRVGVSVSAVGSGVAALRASLSVSSKRLLDQVVNGNGAPPVTAAAAAVAQDGSAPPAQGRERNVGGSCLMDEPAAAAAVSVNAVLQAAAGGPDYAAAAAPSSPASSSTSPTGGPRLVPPGGAPYSRVPQPPPPLQPPQFSPPPAQPQTPPQLSPQPHPLSLPSPQPHQPRPPSQPSPQAPQAMSIFRLRGFGGSASVDGAFLSGGGGDSGGKVPRADSPLGFAVRYDAHAGSAVRYEGAAQPAM